MPPTSEAGIRTLLEQTRTIALVGASDRPDRPSNRVMCFLQEHGYPVIPVNPRITGAHLHGEFVFRDLSQIGEPIDQPAGTNPDTNGVGAMNAEATPCSARQGGCQIGVDLFGGGTAAVRLIQKIVAPSSCCEAPGEATDIGLLAKDVAGAVRKGVGKAFRKKPDTSNRVAIDLAAPSPRARCHRRMCIHSGWPTRLCDPRSRSSACATLRSGPSCVTIATSADLPAPPSSWLAPRCIRLSMETPASRIAAAISASTPTRSATVKRT